MKPSKVSIERESDWLPLYDPGNTSKKCSSSSLWRTPLMSAAGVMVRGPATMTALPPWNVAGPTNGGVAARIAEVDAARRAFRCSVAPPVLPAPGLPVHEVSPELS